MGKRRFRNSQYQVTSFFEVSSCITLSKTLVVNTLDVWILDSVAENLNLPRIHLLPQIILAQKRLRVRKRGAEN